MRRVIVGLSILVLTAGAAFAQERVAEPMDSLGWDGTSVFIDTEGVSYAEDFEAGFIVGNQVAGQNGWVSDFAPNTQVVQPGIENISARHIQDGTLISGFEMNSPTFTGEFGILATDLLLTGTGGLYQLIPDAPSGFFITRVNFETTGAINVGQGDPGCTMFVFQPTTGSWTPGVVTRIAFEVPGDGTLNVYQDGSLIFSGQDLNDQCFAGPEPINQLLTFADNAGTGAFDGTGDTLTLDNISSELGGTGPQIPVVTIPTLDWRGLALLLMALAAVAVWMIRRRQVA